MPKSLLDRYQRYGFALLAVALATAVRLALSPLLGNGYPIVIFFIAIVFAAWYGGYGPSLLAVVLSWFLIDYLFLTPHGLSHIFQSKSHIAFGYFSVGVAVTLFGGYVRSARERAAASASKLQRASRTSRLSESGFRFPWPASPMP